MAIRNSLNWHFIPDQFYKREDEESGEHFPDLMKTTVQTQHKCQFYAAVTRPDLLPVVLTQLLMRFKLQG